MAPVTVDNLKAHLNIVDDDTHDEVLADKLAAADEWVRLYCGIAPDATSIPAPVAEATRKFAAHLFANREVALVGETAQIIPLSLIDLLEPYRRPW